MKLLKLEEFDISIRGGLKELLFSPKIKAHSYSQCVRPRLMIP